MAKYTLAHVQGEAFHQRDRVSALLAEAAVFIRTKEGESGNDVVVTSIQVGYDEVMNPYVNVYYESV